MAGLSCRTEVMCNVVCVRDELHQSNVMLKVGDHPAQCRMCQLACFPCFAIAQCLISNIIYYTVVYQLRGDQCV